MLSTSSTLPTSSTRSTPLAEPQAERRQHHQQVDLEPERGLVQPGRAQALHRPEERAPGPERAARRVAAGAVGHQMWAARRVRPAWAFGGT